MAISLQENDWIRLRQILQRLEEDIKKAGGVGYYVGGEPTQGPPGPPGASGQDGLSVFILYHKSNLAAKPSIQPLNDGLPFYEGKGGWYQTPSVDANWMTIKRSTALDVGTWGEPIPIRGAGAVILTDCVLRYLFEETGVAAVDTSGASNHGTITGSTAFPTGVRGKCLQFTSSTNAKIETPHANSLNPVDGASYSITGWIKNVSANKTIVKKQNSSNVGYRIYLDSNSKLVVELRSSTQQVSITSNAVLNLTNWVFFAVLIDQLNDTCSIYLHGMLDKTADISAVSGEFTNTANLQLMLDAAGSIDEVLFFNRGLYPDEIIQLADPQRRVLLTYDMKGADGQSANLYYIKPLNGTAIKNGQGSLTIQARYIVDGQDTLLSSGDVKLYNAANNQVLGNGYEATITAAMIVDSMIVELKKLGEAPKDTITLIDVKDGEDGVDGVSGYWVDYRFKRSATQPSTPTAVNPTDWFDAPPSGTDPLWMTKAKKVFDGSAFAPGQSWSTPIRLNGEPGQDGDDIYVEYSATGQGNWHSVFNAATDKYMRTKVGLNGTWSDPIKIVGEDGQNGQGGYWVDYRFKRAASQPSAPTAVNPTDWSDGPPSGTDPLWMTKAKKVYDGSAFAPNETWSTPVRLNGEPGQDGDDVYVEYSADGQTNWHSVFNPQSDKYMRLKTGINGTWSDPIKIVGEDAVYGHIETDLGLAFVQQSNGQWIPSSPIWGKIYFYKRGQLLNTRTEFTIGPNDGYLTFTQSIYWDSRVDYEIIGANTPRLTIVAKWKPDNEVLCQIAETFYAAFKGQDGVDATSLFPMLKGITFRVENNAAHWTAGQIIFGQTTYNISASSTGSPYIYFDSYSGAIGTTSVLSQASDPANGRWLICVYDSSAQQVYPAHGNRLINAGLIQVNQLSAITGDMGSLTSGSIELTAPNSLTKWRIDNTGIAGAWRPNTNSPWGQWKYVAKIDSQGRTVASFDAYNSGEIIQDLGTLGINGTDYAISRNTEFDLYLTPSYPGFSYSSMSQTLMSSEQTLMHVEQKCVFNPSSSNRMRIKAGTQSDTVYFKVGVVKPNNTGGYASQEGSVYVSAGQWSEYTGTITFYPALLGVSVGGKFKFIIVYKTSSVSWTFTINYVYFLFDTVGISGFLIKP